MALIDSRVADQPEAAETAPLPTRRRGIVAVASVAIMVAVLAQLPLIRNHIFYFWDDSASAFLPNWYTIGEQLRSGNWPWLRPDMWMGGNYAGEAMTGLFNPVMLANYVVVSLLPDLAVAATLIKTEFLVVLAVGVYLLAREFGAGRRATVAVATAVPFAGYTLYFDAAAWATGLIAFAHLPYFWWALRRFARGRLNPAVPIVIGYLAMTVGNPYGSLGVAVIVAAVATEQLLARQGKVVLHIIAIGLVVGLGTVVVYLPLIGSSAVTWRTGTGITNDGFLVPNLGDFVGLSAPTYQPQFPAFAANVLSFPGAYLAWFILPLAPWLRWSVLRNRLRERASLIVFGAVFLLFLLGPSGLWLFRWPARLTEYVYLPVAVVVALVLSEGLSVTRPARRAAATAVIVLVGAYLSWASSPQHLVWHVAATALLFGLTATAVRTYRQRPERLTGVLVLGTAVLLGLQALLYTGNHNVAPWNFPHRVAELKGTFDHRYEGNTLEIVELGTLERKAPLTPDGAWRDVLPTNIIHVAGVDALNSYTGIGNVRFASTLCMNYYGATCPGAFKTIWEPADGTTATLADALRLRTVVVDPDFTVEKGDPARPIAVPYGWSVVERTNLVTVYKRQTPLAWPAGRLSWTAPGLQVSSDERVGESGERLTYRGSGQALLATLAWPGYRATVDGTPIEVRQGPAGLLQLDLPPAAPGGSELEISFTPPGYRYGIPILAGGLVLALGYGLFWWARRRRQASR